MFVPALRLLRLVAFVWAVSVLVEAAPEASGQTRLGSAPDSVADNLSKFNTFISSAGILATSKDRHRRTQIEFDLSQRMTETFACSPHNPELCDLSSGQLSSLVGFIDIGNVDVSGQLRGLASRCELLYQRLASRLATSKVFRGTARGKRHRRALQRRQKRFVVTALAILFVSSAISAGTGIAGTIIASRNSYSIKDLQLRLNQLQHRQGELTSLLASGELSMDMMMENLHNRTLVLENRADAADKERRLMLPLLNRGLREVRSGIQSAVYSHKLTDDMVPSADLWAVLNQTMPPSLTSDSVYGSNPVLLQELGVFVATSASPHNMTLSGQFAFPLIADEDVYFLVRPVHAGYFSHDYASFAKPKNMPDFVALPAYKNDVRITDIKYPDMAKCQATQGGSYFVCKPEDLKTKPAAGACAVPPTSHCEWSRSPASASFVHSVRLDAHFIVATKLSYYMIRHSSGSKTMHHVRRPIDVYHAGPGEVMQFGKLSLYGQAQVTVHAPSFDFGIANVSFPAPPEKAGDQQWTKANYKFQASTAQLVELKKEMEMDLESSGSSSRSQLSTGLIAAGCACAGGLALLLLLCLLRRCKAKPATAKTETKTEVSTTISLTANLHPTADPVQQPISTFTA